MIEDHIEDGLGVVRLSRPERRNALNHELVDEFLAALARFKEAGVGVARLEAAPPAFCAGNDLAEIEDTSGPSAAERLIGALLTEPLLWIAVIDGPAIGAGVAIAAACPITIAGPEAWFALSERQKVGLYPTGVMIHLEQVIGPRALFDATFLGERFDGARAHEIGLVNEVATDADDLAARVAARTESALELPAVTAAAREAWQHRWTTPAALERRSLLERLLVEQVEGLKVAR
jgi:2-(1,2-epoxy-1,2-dihydrophenyl)acetyl-CoA isomerase